MEHVVFFPSHDGTPAFRRVAGLEDAVRLVEHLRNVEGVAEVSVHALTEVPLAFKTWYRVEVPAAPTAEVPAAADVDAPATEEQAPLTVAEVPEQPAESLVVSNGHAPATPSSLGFFAS